MIENNTNGNEYISLSIMCGSPTEAGTFKIKLING